MLHGAYIGMVLPAQVKETEDVLLIGQGPMGLTATQCAALTARSVATVDIHDNRVAKSREVGSEDIRLVTKFDGSFDAGAVFQQGVDLVAEGRIDMGAPITHEVGFEGVEEALDLCRRHPDRVIKVVVWPP